MTDSIKNLYKIKETYYFRTHIPVDLQKWFDDKDDFKRSLKTKNISQARRLLKVWNFKTEETFTLIRSGMLSQEQIIILANNFKAKVLQELEEDRTSKSKPITHDALDYQLELLQEHEADFRESLAVNDLKRVSSVTEDLIADNGLGEVSESERTAISRELSKKLIEVFQVEQQRLVGNYQNGWDDRLVTTPPSPSVESVVAEEEKAPLLSEMIDKHLADLERKEAANKVTMMGYTSMCQMFLRIIGDIPVSEITRDTLRLYLDTLKKLPPNLNKLSKFRGKSIDQVIKLNEGDKTIATDTITKSLTVVKTFLTWMYAEGVTTKNHSDVLKPPKKSVRPDEERSCFTVEDLNKLVSSLQKQMDENKKIQSNPERYWLPLIGMYSGMRLGEIAQLHIDDVSKVDGIWCFNIQNDEEGSKSLKTASSRRIVPVHDKLIELGFIDYVMKAKEKKQPRLWMKLSKDSRGRYYRNFSNWFLKSSMGEGFLRTYVTKDDKKDFHSLRHTVINNLKQRGVDVTLIAELAGHSVTSITVGRYGKRFEVVKLKETIDQLEYEGVAGL